MLALVLIAATLSADPTPMKILSAEVGPIGLETALKQDVGVIESLRDNGSDLSKPHPLGFYFYFHSKKHADAAAVEIRGAELSIVTVREGAKGGWLVLAQKDVVPTVANVQALTREFTALAERHCGEYDGWEAPTVK